MLSVAKIVFFLYWYALLSGFLFKEDDSGFGFFLLLCSLYIINKVSKNNNGV